MDKQRIIEEIRRTAKANGGVLIGWEQFSRKTGVKESDWKGKHWIRWSQAEREAGFEQTKNFFRQVSNEDMLIEKLIFVMRELGHFPVDAELRMKARSDANFPSTNTFQKRLGDKRTRAAKIQAYCENRTGYDDILVICTAIVKDQPVPDDNTAPEECFGIVYLMKSGRYYKIGFTNDLARREREIKIELPEKLETVHWFLTDDASGIEAYWKNRFKAKCKNGEWFDLNPEDVRAFKRRKSFM